MKDNAGLQSPSSAEESSMAPRPTADDLNALSHFAEQLNTKMASSMIEEPRNHMHHHLHHMHPGGANAGGENVDLDNLFAFLSEIHADGAGSGGAPVKNQVLEEIELQMNELATDFDQAIQTSRHMRCFLIIQPINQIRPDH